MINYNKMKNYNNLKPVKGNITNINGAMHNGTILKSLQIFQQQRTPLSLASLNNKYVDKNFILNNFINNKCINNKFIHNNFINKNFIYGTWYILN